MMTMTTLHMKGTVSFMNSILDFSRGRNAHMRDGGQS